MGFLTRCKRPFLFAFLLQFCNMLFSFFLKTFLILFEKQQRRAAGHGGKGCGAGVSHGSAAGRIPRVCARFFRPAGLSAHPRLHRKAGLVNGRRVPCDAAAFLCRAPMVSPFFHTRMIVLSHPWPILKATSGKKEDVDL